MDKGTDHTSDRVRLLAKRRLVLARKFTGENPEIERSLGKMCRQEKTIHGIATGSMREMMEYVSKAMTDSKKPE